MFSSSIRKVLTDRCISNVGGNNNGVLTHFVSTLHFSAAAQQQQAQSNFRIPLPRQHEWNRAVAAAENLVGFPTSAIQLRSLLTDEVTSMSGHLRKLMGSDHPILRSLKRLVHHGGKTNVQIRGLMVLLLSKATATEQMQSSEDYDEKTGVLGKQRRLAEIVEMINAAQAIHKSVLNLPISLSEEDEKNEALKDDLSQLEYGNKLAILGGDYLLASACTGIAELRNTHIVEMIAVSIAEFAQSEFMGKRDVQGRFLPDTTQVLTRDSWIQRNKLARGSLMAKGCEAAGMLANLSDTTNENLRDIGMNVALALQSYTELEPFIENNQSFLVPSGGQQVLDLSAAPILFHLQSDMELMEYIKSCDNNVDNLDAKRIYEKVISGRGIEMAQDLCKTYTDDALKAIGELEDCDAKDILIKMVSYLNP